MNLSLSLYFNPLHKLSLFILFQDPGFPSRATGCR